MIYVFHFLIIIILYILFGRNKETEKIFIGGSFFHVLFVFGQRWMTGTDFPHYLRYYITDFVRSEWGYFGLQQLFSNLNLYFGLLVFVVLLITQINFYRFFLKFENHAPLLIAIYLISEMFFGQMSQIRQYAAISFFINSYYCAHNKEYPKSIINLILGYSFHASALFFIPFLFLKLPVTKNIKLVIAFMFSALLLPMFDIRLFLQLPFFSRYSGYVGGYFDVPLSINHHIKYYTIIIVFIYYLLHLKPIKETIKNKLILNGLIFYILIYGMSFNFALLYRVASFFQVFEIVFLIYFADKLTNISDVISRKIVSLLFIGIFSMASLVDSYRVGEYEFRTLRIYEDKTEEELRNEIATFND